MWKILEAKISLYNVSGNIKVPNSKFSNMNINAISSSVNFNQIDSGYIHIKTTSGNIVGSVKTSKEFSAKSISGKINLPENSKNGKSFAETISGNIEITALKTDY